MYNDHLFQVCNFISNNEILYPSSSIPLSCQIVIQPSTTGAIVPFCQKCLTNYEGMQSQVCFKLGVLSYDTV
jgi:hypothetical protein